MYVIDDISNVIDDFVDDEKIDTLVAAKVNGVHDTYYICIFCKKGDVDVRGRVCR